MRTARAIWWILFHPVLAGKLWLGAYRLMMAEHKLKLAQAERARLRAQLNLEVDAKYLVPASAIQWLEELEKRT